VSTKAKTAKEINGVMVSGDVTIIPTKRTATYDVELGPKPPAIGPGARAGVRRAPVMSARVNAKSITFGGSSDIPKTLAAVDAILALAYAVRDELEAQGVKS